MAPAELRHNKWFRRATWGAGGLLLFWAVAWLAVPPIVKSQVEKAATAQLGRQVRIGSVDFRPWTLELTVHDLAISGLAGPDGAPPQLAVKRIYIDAELQSLLRLAPIVDAVTLEGVQARLVHLGGGRYDIDDVLAKLAAMPPADPAAGPARFALYNLSVRGGSFDFDDKAVGKVQQLRELQVSLPFLSNLASDREVKVEPRLAFKLNGSNFDSAAQGTPFAQSRKTDASIKLSAFDLRPWLGYIPAAVPVRVQTAVLDADLRLAFEQSPKLAVRLSGSVTASGVKVTDVPGQPLLGFESLRVDLADVRPLEREAALAAVALTGPRLEVSRDRGGRLNLAALLVGASPSAAVPAPPALPPASSPASAAKAGAVPSASPWKLSLAKLEVRAGTVAWADALTTPKADMLLQGIVLDASALALPFAQPFPFSGSGALEGKQPATFAFSGSATDQAASVTLTVGALPLAAAAPYLAQQMTPALAGSLTGEFGLAWKAPQLTQAAGKAQDIQLAIRSLVLDKLALTQGKSQLASIQKLELLNSQVDVARQSVNLGKLSIVQPKAGVERGEDGRWMFERWMKAEPGKAAAVVAPATGAPAAAPWTLALGELLLSGGNIQFQDKSRARPVSFEVSALQVQARNFALDGKKPSPVSVSARIGAGQTEPGKLDFRGAAAMEPLAVQGQVDAVDLPLHAFEPYFGDALNIELLRADASFKGRMRFAQTAGGPSLKVTGDTALEEFRANSVQVQPQGQTGGQGTPTVATRGLQAAEELLSWRALSLRGLDVTMAPGAATLVDVKETVLSDFFARIIINETGRINLQDVVKASVPAGTTSTMVATATAVATAAVSTATGSATPPVISFGPVNLLNGKVLFSDRFVKPSYTANLTELNGKLSAFSSVSPPGTPAGTPQMADLELRGRAEGTASLEILGKLNPLAKPLALDIKGKVRDLELPPLSPYSIKYAGHGIERGKLSLDVAYLVKPDGQLTASNRLILNQLGFGEAVPGAPASLPVKLAVALLADRNGMIDIDLPVSGSLNDPQFSLGPVIFKIIVNVITKALTAPFSLLAGAFGGGGDELNIVVFSPGTAVLEPEAQKGLDRIAKALADRPGLKMTVVGTASLDVEREAMKRERLKQLVQAEKRRESVVAGGTATGTITVAQAEYPALLKEVYKRADIKKPRNVIGMAKDLPQAEMEELLLANVVVNEETMRELAVQRGVAVRDYLASQKLPLDRLFLGAAKAVAPEARWSPRAELNLAAQ